MSNRTTTLKDPVLIVGAGRSGTSLVRSILRVHPEIYGISKESAYVTDLFRRYGDHIEDVPSAVEFVCSHDWFPRDVITPQSVAEEFRGETSMSGAEFLDRLLGIALREQPGKRLLIKDPRSSIYLEPVTRLFPGLRIVCMVRDPRGVMSSLFKLMPNITISEGVHFWCESVRQGVALQSARPDRCLLTRFEDLVTGPRETLERICKFLALPFSEKLMEFTQPAGYARAKGEFDQTTLHKWKSDLSLEQIQFVETQCRAEMDAFGYPVLEPAYSRLAFRRLVEKERLLSYGRELGRLKSSVMQVLSSR